MDVLYFFGRFHPLILHLPIGGLVIGFILEFVTRKGRNAALKPALSFVWMFSAISAVVVALLGYLLSLEGGYETELLSWHQWSGIALATGSVGLYYAHKKESKLYLPLLGLNLILLMMTGHYGGSLTHGSDFIAEHAPAPFKPLLGGGSGPKAPEFPAHTDSAIVFHHIIQPILQEKCVGCHRPGKSKGELVLNSVPGILAGGENGPVLIAGNATESPLIQRILLPLAEEDHMPPKGRKQLTKEEKELLDWWIAQSAGFDKRVADCEVPPEIERVLASRYKPKRGIWALDVPALKASKVQSLVEDSINIRPLAQNSPWLEVNLSGRKDLDNSQLKKLKKAANQIMRLNLAASNITDELLTFVKDLPHLAFLHLENTAITDKGLQHLKDKAFLEYLNLYGTQVTDAGLDHLGNLPELRQLYLWQTNVTSQGVSQLAEKIPELEANIGLEQDTTFQSVALKAPVILAEKELFENSIEVELKLNFIGVNIFYTLDGSDPDSNSLKYERPITLTESKLVKVIATKTGWQSSEVAEKQFVRIKYRPNEIKLANRPNDKYAGKGGLTLMDFQKGSLRFQDGNWLGWEGEHAVAVIDLGATKEVSSVTVGALEATASWIFFPKGIKVWTSTNGQNFQKIHEAQYPTAEEPLEASLRNFTESFKNTEARYVKVMVESNLKNPDWHPNPGGACWVFVDEISVE